MKPTHAGCIVYRNNEDRKEYLVLTSIKAPHDWVLPKGHIEPGEADEQAALRELQEEANITGTIEKDLGLSKPFRIKDEDIVVHYFLVGVALNVDPGNSTHHENRQFKWLFRDELLKTISFHEIQELLMQI